MHLAPAPRLFGGFSGAERAIACFGDGEINISGGQPPVTCVKISPRSEKFSEELSHRDFLGSLMALGIKRELLGDICVYEKCAYLFCLESIAPFIVSELNSVKRTSVDCEIQAELPEQAASLPEMTVITVPSERLDALVACVYRLSRGDAQELFALKRIFINSALCVNTSKNPEPGSIISVRGFGRFRYEGEQGRTKKDRIKAGVRIW